MKIGLIDFVDWEYTVQSIRQVPLGGSQSAACGLARCLAELGQEVFLINHTKVAANLAGVHHVPMAEDYAQQVPSLHLDALIVIQRPANGKYLKAAMGAATRLVLWLQDAAEQPNVQVLREPLVRDAYDGFALVSHWQSRGHRETFGVDPARMALLRNCISPPFMGLFGEEASILPHKTWPPVIAYSSAPDRGLRILLDVFPEIRRQVPGTRLAVFSSMKLYRMKEAEDAQKHGSVYEQCLQTEGVDYVGVLPQPQLAQRLREISVLTYPSIVPETSCMAVMEAMAAGCRIVTSDLGALSETTAGFGRLIPGKLPPQEYAQRFTEQVVAVLRESQTEPAAVEDLLRRQVDFVNASCTWPACAPQWLPWLGTLQARPSPLSLAQLQDGDRKVDLAVEQFRAARFSEARALCREVLDQQPHYAHALYLLGLMAHQNGENESALDFLERAAAIDPQAAQYHAKLGLVRAALGRMDQAIDALCQALTLDPKQPDVYNNLGNVLCAQGDWDRAIVSYQRALSQQPQYPEAYNNLGNALRARGDLDQAVAAYRKAMEWRPNYVQAHGNLALALSLMKRWEEAIDAFRCADTLRPDHVPTLVGLGDALLASGRVDEGMSVLSKAARLRSAHPEQTR